MSGEFREIRLTQGQVVIVDCADYEWLNQWKWRLRSGYVSRATRAGDGACRTILMHREILGLSRGDRRQGHHSNHDTLDNRRANLSIVTAQQNSTDQRKRIGASGLKGASWRKDAKRWRASIMVSGRTLHLGYHDTADAAHAAYRKAAVKYQGQYARFSN